MNRSDVRTWRTLIVLITLVATLVLSAAISRAQSPLTSVPGSPFQTTGGYGSQVVLLRPGEQQLFVSNQYSNTITVNKVAANGALSLQGVYIASYTNPTYTYNFVTVTGMTTNPAGDRLYVVGLDFSGTSSVSVHSVAADGTLTWMQDALLPYGSAALNGIVYVSQSGGDTVYINDNAYTNQVSAFPVAADGTLVTPSTEYNTGGNSYPYGGFISAPSVRAGAGYLFAQNGNVNSSGSNDISVFKINANGSLTSVAGSPFKLPNGEYTSGAIALDAPHGLLYAGTQYRDIVKFSIGSDGTLSSLGAFPVGLYSIDALDLRPGGSTLVATDNNWRIGLVDTASMRPLLGSPVGSDGVGAGALFDSAGARLFAGDNYWYNSPSQVSVYSFTKTPILPPLAIQLKVTGGSVDKFGAATITGTITSSDPMFFSLYNLMLRQKQGHDVLTVYGNYAYATTTGINGTATWTCKFSSSTQAFKGGTAEVIASTSGSDPATFMTVTANLDQAVQLGGK